MPKRAIVFSAFAILVSSLYFCTSRDEKKTEKQYASLSDSTEYVGMETCAGCHRDIYNTYIQTGMGQSFDVASARKSSAKFSSHALVRDAHKNLNYYPYWSGDGLYLNEFRKEGRDTVYSNKQKINYIVGSGQHTNSHMVNSNGYVYQAPATFYTQKGVWDLPPGFEGGHNSRFGRKIELECMSCHNAFPQMVEGSENKYSYVANGIDCERCHGPGSKHVAEKKMGHLVDVTKEIDYTIVNPAKLPIDRQLDVCQRCHIQGNAVLAEGKTFFDFRPAMHLSEVMNVFMPVYKGQENEHIMASHAERMKMSPCFTASVRMADEQNKLHPSLTPYKNALTCVTCHNPHVSVKATGSEVFNASCRKCHSGNGGKEKLARTDCSAPMATRTAAGDNCSGCHMPKNSTIDIPHVQTTDHFIRKPVSAGAVDQIREFIGLACINNPSPDAATRGKAYLSYYEKFDHRRTWLDSAKKYIGDTTLGDVRKNFNSLVRWAFLKEDYPRVLDYASRGGEGLLSEADYSNDDAWTAYRIGEACLQLQRLEDAQRYFETAVRLAPFVPDFRSKLGSAQLLNKHYAEARKNFQFLLKENPEYVPGYVNLGYLTLTIDRNVAAADALYDRALSLDPDHEQALLNKAGTQVFMDRPAEAKRLLRHLLSVNPGHERAKELLHALK